MAIKAKELAQTLGVSEATLSLILNRKGSISQKTRAAVTKKIIDMGYGYMFKDNVEAADASVRKESELPGQERSQGCIGFVIYKDSGLFMENTSFFPLIIDGMDMVARKYGYRFLVINISRDMDTETKLNYIRESGCAGYVIYAPELPLEEADNLQRLQIPFVLLDNYFPGKEIDAVTLDNDQGICVILKMLMKKGHRKIGYLSGGVNLQSFRERRANFRRYIKESGLELNEGYVADIGYPDSEAYEGMLRYIRRAEELPTAFVTDNDCVAFGAIKALQDSGYGVPEDISVVGFSDRPLCMYIIPNITTVRIPRMRFGGEAVELLIQKVMKNPYEEEKSTIRIQVSMKLVERESAGAAPKRK